MERSTSGTLALARPLRCPLRALCETINWKKRSIVGSLILPYSFTRQTKNVLQFHYSNASSGRWRERKHKRDACASICDLCDVPLRPLRETINCSRYMAGSLTRSSPVSTRPAKRFSNSGFPLSTREVSYHPKLFLRSTTTLALAPLATVLLWLPCL